MECLMHEALTVESLECGWDGQASTLKDITFSLPPGARLALLGANGCGKSTLLLALNGSLPARAGRIRLGNETLQPGTTKLRKWRHHVGLVLSDADHMLVGGTVESDLSFGPLNLGMAESDVRDRVHQVIDEFGLQRWRSAPITTLSAGIKKRVSLAGVVAMNPAILLLDEPANGLDAPGNRALRDALQRLQRERRTLVIATHDVDFAWEWATHWLVLEEGSVAYFGETCRASGYLAQQPQGIAIPRALEPHSALVTNTSAPRDGSR